MSGGDASSGVIWTEEVSSNLGRNIRPERFAEHAVVLSNGEHGETGLNVKLFLRLSD